MMALERFEDLAQTYGGEIARWPEGEREAAEWLAERLRAAGADRVSGPRAPGREA